MRAISKVLPPAQVREMKNQENIFFVFCFRNGLPFVPSFRNGDDVCAGSGINRISGHGISGHQSDQRARNFKSQRLTHRVHARSTTSPTLQEGNKG
jgi:hypothetical protein